jgi:unspecific monooxygenase
MKTLTQSPTDPTFVQNPYGFYETARATGDLIYWADYNRICATTHASVNHFLRDKNWGREIPSEFTSPIPDHIKPFMDIEAHSMLERDPPEHTKLRSSVLRDFTSRRIQSLAPDVETLANTLIDQFDATPDLLPAFCTPIPVTIIARLIGAPETDAPLLLDWSHKMVAMYLASRTRTDEDAAAQASTEVAAYLMDLQTERTKRPQQDLISALVSGAGAKLSGPELTSTCILLLNAGHEATVHALANATKTLLQTHTHPTDSAIEETLRFDPPLHLFERHAKSDCEAFGQTFKHGDTVACLLACANRDTTAFSDPETFIPTRPKNPHVSFGAGIHFCIGAPLARLELQIGLKTLFTRCPEMQLAEQPTYANTFHFHGLNSLKVSV